MDRIRLKDQAAFFTDIIYTFIATSPLKKDEMTYWSPISTVKVKDDIEQTDVTNINQLTVDVQADAIQSEGFADATAAFAAFDTQNS